jgi:hypothetical protein
MPHSSESKSLDEKESYLSLWVADRNLRLWYCGSYPFTVTTDKSSFITTAKFVGNLSDACRDALDEAKYAELCYSPASGRPDIYDKSLSMNRLFRINHKATSSLTEPDMYVSILELHG